MSPIDDSHTFLDLIVALAHPAILVTGTYLGAISHTLTAICALKSRSVPIQGVVISESPRCAGILDVLMSLKCLEGPDLPIYTLPRISAGREPKWRRAGSLLDASRLSGMAEENARA